MQNLNIFLFFPKCIHRIISIFRGRFFLLQEEKEEDEEEEEMRNLSLANALEMSDWLSLSDAAPTDAVAATAVSIKSYSMHITPVDWEYKNP